MPATREQLEKRWETDEGQSIAQAVCRLLSKGLPGVSMPRAVTAAELQPLLASLPFSEEVTPMLDLRGLHLKQGEVDLYHGIDLSGAHLEYAHEIGAISATRMVGTCFDGCFSINASFSADFTEASFVGAKLQGVRFWPSTLVQTNFRQAKLALAELRERDCRRASFIEADLRFIEAWQVDLRNADLTGADLTEANLAKANLSGIQFNEQTRLQGTNLYGAILDNPFRAFAEQAGAILREDQDPSFTEHERAKLAAIITILQRDNDDGRLDPAIACLIEQARHFANDPSYPWSMEMHQQLSPEMEQEVIERYGEVGKTLAYYL